jgi:hypothetical protein
MDLNVSADCIDVIIWVDQYTDQMYIESIGAIVGLAHVLVENAASGSIHTLWHIKNPLYLDNY